MFKIKKSLIATALAWLRPGAVVGTLPNNIQNGQIEDAVPVMANFNYIVNQVNANAAPLANTPTLSGANTFTSVQSGIPATAGPNFPTAAQVQNNLGYAIDTGTADAYVLEPAVPVLAYADGQQFTMQILNTNLTTAPTVNVSGLGVKTLVNADGSELAASQLRENAVVQFVYNLALDKMLVTSVTSAVVNISALRSYIAGLTMSTAGGSGTMTIAAGVATSDDQSTSMVLGSSISKTTASWAVGTGNGGLDTGSIANNTWYSFFEIERLDTGVVDVIFSLSATAPTLPANYTKKRRIGSAKTNGSGLWLGFTQDGAYFRLAGSPLDVNATNPGTSAVAATLGGVPTGVSVQAIINIRIIDTGSANPLVYVSDLAAGDEAPTTGNAPLGQTRDPNNTGAYWGGQIRTNTSAQLRYRLNASSSATTFEIATLGWFDSRGSNA